MYPLFRPLWVPLRCWLTSSGPLCRFLRAPLRGAPPALAKVVTNFSQGYLDSFDINILFWYWILQSSCFFVWTSHMHIFIIMNCDKEFFILKILLLLYFDLANKLIFFKSHASRKNHAWHMYRVFIKYCVFFGRFKIFRTLAFFCFPSDSVCVHTPGRKKNTRTYRVQKNQVLRKNTIFNEHPVCGNRLWN